MWSWLAAGAGVLLVLAGCTGQPDGDQFVGDPVPYQSCAQQCAGTLAGAPYRILMPQKWNGTLLMYSHGYRAAEPTPPDFEPVDTSAEPSPGYGGSRQADDLAQALLDRGYALAGSAYARNGWAVADGVRANEQLYKHFAATVAKPDRVYLWGDSLGGLITAVLAEKGHSWVSAAAPMCGPLAGIVPNMDLALDLAVTYKTLLDPGFQLTDYGTPERANAAFERASARISEAAGAGGRDSAAVLALGAVIDAAAKTSNSDARDATSRVLGATESALVGMAFATTAREEAEDRFGGNISSNVGVSYAGRFSRLDQQWIDKVGGEGTAAQFIEELGAAPQVPADPGARRRAQRQGGDPSGTLEVPTITLHTAADPLVIVQNEARYRERAEGAGDRLLQLFTVPPRRYLEGAPYGAGHCNFTAKSRLALIDLVDSWVRTGTRPPAEMVAGAMAGTGYDPQYVPPQWP